MKSIEITIASDGSSKVETVGFSGDHCRQASRFIEQTLGKPVRERLKPEFYAGVENSSRLQQES